jgi:parallel beta-helix repeat protein
MLAVVVCLFVSMSCWIPLLRPGFDEFCLSGALSSGAFKYAPHDVISIDGDADFASRAEAESWPGDGTEHSPYIIANYSISGADSMTAVTISNTRVHFVITECWLHEGRDHGIHLQNAFNGSITSNLCTDNAHNGIQVEQSIAISVSDNNCSGNERGIEVLECPHIDIHNNTCTLNTWGGINVEFSGYSTLRANVCTDNYHGMSVFFSPWTLVDANNLSENEMGGLGVTACGMSNVTDNVGVRNGGTGMHGSGPVHLASGNLFSYNYGHGMGVTAYRLFNNTCTFNGLSGIHGSGFREVRGNNCSSNSDGIVLDESGFPDPRIDRYLTDNDCRFNSNTGITVTGTPLGSEQRYITIANNSCSFTSGSGISLNFVMESVVADNSCIGNAEFGAILRATGSTRLTGNDFSYNGRHGLNFTYFEVSGLGRYYSEGIQVDNCTFAGNMNGSAYLDEGSGFEFEDCSFSEESKISVLSDNSTIMVLRRNVMTGCGVFIRSSTLNGWNSHTIEDTNMVNGKPVMYLVGGNAAIVPPDLGQVILVECTNMLVQGQLLNDVSMGLVMAYSHYNTVTENDICCCLCGVYLNHSDTNTFTKNAICNNTGYGIHIDNGFQNSVVNNSFFFNNGAGFAYSPMHVQARDDGMMNRWNDSCFGNYWSDWTSPDSEPDGIVDVPYALDGTAGAMDYFPLVGMPVPIPEFSPAALCLALMSVIALVCALAKRSRKIGER